MAPYVLDASVIIKWFLHDDEADSDAALNLRTQFASHRIELTAPLLLLYEVANTLARRLPTDAEAAVEALQDTGIRMVAPSVALNRRAIELVKHHAVTFYDASYHALALEEGGIFVTADRKYLDRAVAAGSICHLRDWNAT